MSAFMAESVLLEGKKVGERIREELRREIGEIKKQDGTVPNLACLILGNDPAAESYTEAQEKCARALGIEFQRYSLDDRIDEESLIGQIEDLNMKGSGVHGIMIQLPLPSHIDPANIYCKIDPQKDVEGIHPASLGFLLMRKAKLIPATALACMTLIDETGIDCRGKEAVIVGQSAIVGRPVQLLLAERRATTILCNTGTPELRLASFVQSADIVVACAGKPGLIRGEWIREGAVVIDVGTTEVNGKIVGDVQFEEAKKRAKFITPVPGGVGPLTVLMLMKNLLRAYRLQRELS